ncbi:MAG: PEGA domain-containing protein [Nitrospirae bacterium]|nr:PEGA domain-containing protein [Nitrospirota bacterium]
MTRVVSVVVLTLFLGGCATMATVDQQVSITSDPPGADVKIGGLSGTTPMSVTLPTGYAIPQAFHIQKDGYQPQTVGIQRGFRTSALVQDIFPGMLLAFVPLFVDAITGDWYYIANTSYHVRLLPVPGGNGAEKK